MKKSNIARGAMLFGTPPENMSVLLALNQLNRYIALYGLEKAQTGALGRTLLSWAKNTDQSIEVDTCEAIKRSPVLFSVSYQSTDPKHAVEFIFTGAGVYRINDDGKRVIGNTGAMTVIKVVPVTVAELKNAQKLITCIGHDIALEFNCLLWRIENNPRDFSQDTE